MWICRTVAEMLPLTYNPRSCRVQHTNIKPDAVSGRQSPLQMLLPDALELRGESVIDSVLLRAQFHKAGHGVEVPRCGRNLQLLFKEIIGKL